MDVLPEKTQVHFLGFAERAMAVQEANTPFTKWNIIGLKHTLLTFIVPLPISGIHIALAVMIGREDAVTLRIKSASGEEIGRINLQFANPEPQPTTATKVADGQVTFGRYLMMFPDAWNIVVATVDPTPSLLVPQPGHYTIAKIEGDNSEVSVGSFNVELLMALPLSRDVIAAIRSDPFAAKSVRIDIGCKYCASKLRAFASLDQKPNSDGYIWYQDLPNEFQCSCGATKMDVRSIKHNLHGLLTLHQSRSTNGQVSITPLYEMSAVQAVRDNFSQLLQRDPPEEEIQKFIEANPITLHQFPARKLYFKPAILTFFKADFAILTSSEELIFIEIEKTTTRLMKKDGHDAADLSHSLNQVHDWLHIADEHRLAILETLGIDRVSAIRGVVIAGRDGPYNSNHLRRLKGVDRGRVNFFSFDDLVFSLSALADRLQKL